MIDRFSDVLRSTIKTAAAAWGVVALEPWLDKTFPQLPVVLSFLIASIVSALLIEILYLFILGRPTVKIEWKNINNDSIGGTVVAKMRDDVQDYGDQVTAISQPLRIVITTLHGSFVGNWLFRKVCSSESVLVVNIDNAPVEVTCESSTRTKQGNCALVSSGSAGVSVTLGDVPFKPTTWRVVELRWNATKREKTNDELYSVSYEFRDVNQRKKALMRTCIKIVSDVSYFKTSGV